MRSIEVSDLYAAARGCSMLDASERELHELVAEHAASELFAGKVIAAAARALLDPAQAPAFRIAARAAARRPGWLDGRETVR